MSKAGTRKAKPRAARVVGSAGVVVSDVEGGMIPSDVAIDSSGRIVLATDAGPERRLHR